MSEAFKRGKSLILTGIRDKCSLAACRMFIGTIPSSIPHDPRFITKKLPKFGKIKQTLASNERRMKSGTKIERSEPYMERTGGENSGIRIVFE